MELADILAIVLVLILFAFYIIFIVFRQFRPKKGPAFTSPIVRNRGYLFDKDYGWGEITGGEYLNKDTFALTLRTADTTFKPKFYKGDIEPMNTLQCLSGSGSPMWITIRSRNYMDSNKYEEMLSKLKEKTDRLNEMEVKATQQVLETDERTKQVVDAVTELKKADRIMGTK